MPVPAATPPTPVLLRSPSSKSPRASPRAASPRSEVLWLPELMRRRSLEGEAAAVAAVARDLAKDLSLPKTESDDDMVALDMSASILIQHAKDDDDEHNMLDNTPGEGPGAFPCASCGKVYRWKRTLRNHLRSECGKEPQFQCPYCHLRSKRKSNIYAHIRVVHHKPV